MLRALERLVTSLEFKTLQSTEGTVSRSVQDEKKRSGGVKSVGLMNKRGFTRLKQTNHIYVTWFWRSETRTLRAAQILNDIAAQSYILSLQTDKHRLTVPGWGAWAAAADDRAAGSTQSRSGLGAADGAGGETRLQAERLEKLQFRMQIIDQYINH